MSESSYTIDLTGKAREGGIDPVIGREREIRQVISILTRRRRNQPILIGEPGVGKTAIVEALAQRIALGDVPPALKGAELRSLDLSRLQAGAGTNAELESRWRTLVDELQASSAPVLLFVDDAHGLPQALASSELRMIAATTWGGYRQCMARDATLQRRFQRVQVDEPDEDAAVHMLLALKPRYEAFHGVTIADEAVLAAVRLALRYITAGQLPEKGVDLLDTASAGVCADPEPNPREVSALTIAQIVTDRTGISAERLLQDDIGKLYRLEASLGARVLGQEPGLAMIAELLRSAGLGLRKARVGAFLLAGPSGVGKTETALAMAEQLHGCESSLTIIDMAAHTGADTVARLTDAVLQRPCGVLLLKEIAQAPDELLQALCRLIDQGFLRDGQGRRIDFRNSLILMSARLENPTAKELWKQPEEFGIETLQARIRPEMLRRYGPALLARVQLVPYLPLGIAQLTRVVGLKLEAMAARLQDSWGIQIHATDELRHLLAEECSTLEGGAHPVDCLIEQNLLPAISSELLIRMSRGAMPVAIFISADAHEGINLDYVDDPGHVSEVRHALDVQSAAQGTARMLVREAQRMAAISMSRSR